MGNKAKGQRSAMSVSDSSGAPPAGGPGPTPHHGVAGRLRTYFLTGLVVAGPLAITIWLVWSFVTWVDDLVRPFIPLAYRPETYLPIKVPGFGLIIAFTALTTLGLRTWSAARWSSWARPSSSACRSCGRSIAG
jgi:hypothetical protein